MNNILFSILMLASFMMTSCDRQDSSLQSMSSGPEVQLANRTIDDCDQCPISDPPHCCCAVELVEGTNVVLMICCTYNSAPTLLCGTYTLPNSCSTVAGFNSYMELDPMGITKELMCLPVGGSFRIVNLSSGTVTIKIHCRPNDIDPQYTYIELDPNEDAFFISNGSCFLAPCD